MNNVAVIPQDEPDKVWIPDSRKFDGRAMSALPAGQRAFVIELLKQGAKKNAARKAALACGYSERYGVDLMRDEAILTAIREEATKRLAGAALVGVNVMLEIAQDKDHRDRFKAAKELAAINGFTAEQRIVVEHVDRETKAQISQIRAMAKELGLEAAQLIAAAGIKDSDVVDAEFVEVEDDGG